MPAPLTVMVAPGVARPKFMTMRHTAIYETPQEADTYVAAVQTVGAAFLQGDLQRWPFVGQVVATSVGIVDRCRS